MLDRNKIVEEIRQTVCNDRQDQYGQPEDSFALIAKFWSDYLDINISSEDVAILMSLLKIARIKTGQFKPDNFIDLAGYAVCGLSVAEDSNKCKE